MLNVPLLFIITSLCEGVDTSEPNAVVVGLAPDHFNYQKLNEAFRCFTGSFRQGRCEVVLVLLSVHSSGARTLT